MRSEAPAVDSICNQDERRLFGVLYYTRVMRRLIFRCESPKIIPRGKVPFWCWCSRPPKSEVNEINIKRVLIKIHHDLRF